MHVKNKIIKPLAKLVLWLISILYISTQAIVIAQNHTEPESQYLRKIVLNEKRCVQCHTV